MKNVEKNGENICQKWKWRKHVVDVKMIEEDDNVENLKDGWRQKCTKISKTY